MTDKLYKTTQAHTRYKNLRGEVVPGVTTILGVLNKPALVKWANDLGLAGIDSTKYVDAAARIGTLIHAMVVSSLMGLELDKTDYSENEITQATVGYKKFIDWKSQHDVLPILCEQSYISENLQYGGQIDCYAKVDGLYTLLDFKTGKAIYDEQFCQLAAYKRLLDEEGMAVENTMILRIGRNEEEGFEFRMVNPLGVEAYFQIYESCHKIYQVKKHLGWR
jgi:hypothetical protein